MIITGTPAERLDRAVERLLGGEDPTTAAAAVRDPELRDTLHAAATLRRALAPPPLSARFEERLGARLAEATRSRRGALQAPTRLLVMGAISSAAVGVGVTVYAFWRSNRRQARLAGRLGR